MTNLCKSSAPERTVGVAVTEEPRLPGSGVVGSEPALEGTETGDVSISDTCGLTVEGSVAEASEPCHDINGETAVERTLDAEDSKEILYIESLESPLEEGVLNVYDKIEQVTDETTHLLGSGDESSESESQTRATPTDTKGSLPDLVESAEQSVKDKESPTSGTGPETLVSDSSCKTSAEQSSCPYCSTDLTNKMTNCNSDSHIPTEIQDNTIETGDTNNASGFVNFSSGIFIRDCKHCTAVPDITESLKDTSITERELEAIKAEGREIRRHSDLLSELPEVNSISNQTEIEKNEKKTRSRDNSPEDEKIVKTTDVNKAVVLGYSKTNFEGKTVP